MCAAIAYRAAKASRAKRMGQKDSALQKEKDRFSAAQFIDLFGSDNAKLDSKEKSEAESASIAFSDSSVLAMFRDLDVDGDGKITMVTK